MKITFLIAAVTLASAGAIVGCTVGSPVEIEQPGYVLSDIQLQPGFARCSTIEPSDAEKAVILKGPWPWAHNVVMETKEHLFFIPLVLALYLPFVTRGDMVRSKPTRIMAMAVAFLIVGSSLVIEGAGALINAGAKVAFIHSGAKGTEK